MLGRALVASLCASCTMSAAVAASDPDSWAENERAAAAACIVASGLRAAAVTAPPRRAMFGDDVGLDALVVTGTDARPSRRGGRRSMLCLWQRGTRQAVVAEATGWVAR